MPTLALPPRVFLLALLAALGLAVSLPLLGSRDGVPQTSAATLPALAAGWPSTLQIGHIDGPGGAAALRSTAPFGFRYQYLAGGVNTGGGWAHWNPDGAFVRYYIDDSRNHSITPVFSYYMIRHSNPGAGIGEGDGVYLNLQTTATMTAYYNDLKLFFQRAAEFPSQRVVLHVEPDLWGFAQTRASNDVAASVPAKVGSTGLPELAGMPDNIAGMARAIVKLRDSYAPNVTLGYHMSVWGTGEDFIYTDPSNAHIDTLATRAGNFYKSLGANFDVIFSEFTDRDAAFKQIQYGDAAAWWDSGDFARHVRFLTTFVSVAQKRVVLWQIPLGNTKMRAMNNTWGHYQDNRPEWLLDDATRAHLDSYVQAGVIAFLFGGGAGGTTCACDAEGDGITNPPAINGNNTMSLSADDDGGFFRQKAAAYYAQGAMPLGSGPPAGTSTPAPTSTRTPTPVHTATRTPTGVAPSPTRTPTPPSTAQGWVTSATLSRPTMTRGQTQTVTVSVRNSAKAVGLIDVEVYGPSGRVAQRYWDNVPFRAGVAKSFKLAWTAPSNAELGTYVVRVGIFIPGWGTLYHWNNSAGTFVVK
jgi:hypothetical protein